MAQLTGNSLVQSSNSESNVMEEAVSLAEIGSNSYGKEATRQYSSIVKIFKHTGGEIFELEMLNQPRRHTSQLVTVWIPQRMFIQSEVHIEGWTHRRRARNHTPQYSPKKFTTKHDGSTLKALFIGSLSREHKKKAQRFGTDCMQSSQTARCHLTVLNA